MNPGHQYQSAWPLNVLTLGVADLVDTTVIWVEFDLRW